MHPPARGSFFAGDLTAQAPGHTPFDRGSAALHKTVYGRMPRSLSYGNAAARRRRVSPQRVFVE